MGILGKALAGAGQAAYALGIEEYKNQALAMRDERLAALQRANLDHSATLSRETHAANAAVDIANIPAKGAAENQVAVDKATALSPIELQKKRDEAEIEIDKKKREPRTLAPGSSEVSDGKITLTAPDKPKTKEEIDVLKAHANYYNAAAQAARQRGDAAGTPKAEKPMLPKTRVVQEGEDRYIIDDNSGAIGIINKGEPAVPGEKNWLSADKPGKPATPASIQWSYNGQMLPGGLADLYPAIKNRVGDIDRPQASGPTKPSTQAEFDALPPGARYVNPSDGKEYIKKDKPTQAPRSAPQAPSAPSVPPIQQNSSFSPAALLAQKEIGVADEQAGGLLQALKTSNLSTEQKSALSLQLQKRMREIGIMGR